MWACGDASRVRLIGFAIGSPIGFTAEISSAAVAERAVSLREFVQLGRGAHLSGRKAV